MFLDPGPEPQRQGDFMEKKLWGFALVMLFAILVCSAAFADIQIVGSPEVIYQIDLPDNKPESEGFYNRGVDFWLEDYTNDVGDPVWSVSSTDNGPAFLMETDEWNKGSSKLKADPAATLVKDTVYHYTIFCHMNGQTYTKDVEVKFVDRTIPDASDFSLTVSPVKLTDTTADIGTAVPVQNGNMEMITGNTYVVSARFPSDGIFGGSAIREAAWSDTEWKNVEWYNDSRFSLDGNYQDVYTAKKPGKYEHSYVLQFTQSNLAYYFPYTLYLLDENGEIPKTTPEVVGNYSWASSADVIDYTMYLGLPLYDNSCPWNSRDIVNFHISNYEQMAAEFGGEPKWSISCNTTSGTENLDLEKLSVYGSQVLAGLNSMPTQPLEAEITLTCTWGDSSVVKKIMVHIVPKLAEMPTGLDNLPDVIETKVGETLTLAPAILPSSFVHPVYEPHYFAANGQWQFAERNWNVTSAASATYTITTAGIFKERIGLSYGALYVTKEVIFRVADENGKVPETRLELSQTTEHINRYLGLTNEIKENTGVFSWNALTRARISESLYEQLESQIGGSPVWKVTQTKGDPLPFTWDTEEENHIADVRLEAQALMDQNIQPGNYEITITCTWGDQTVSTVTSVDILNLPNGLPAGIAYNDGSDTVNCKIGDTLTVKPTIVPSDWGGIPGYKPVYMGNSGEFERFCEVISDDDSGRILQVTNAGIYQCFVGVGVDTITAGRWITYRVADEKGNIPKTLPSLSSQHGLEWKHYIGMDFEEKTIYAGKPQSETQLAWIFIDNWDECCIQYAGDPVFSVVSDEAVPQFYVEDNEGNGLSIELKSIPTVNTDVTYTVSCDWDQEHVEQKFVVHYVDTYANNLPTGIDIAFDVPMVVTVGDRIEVPAVFKNNWNIPGFEIYSWLGGGNNIWEGVTYEEHDGMWGYYANISGVYDANVTVGCANVKWMEGFTLIIKDAEGKVQTTWTLPAGITRIESEAFSGTKIQVADIPFGVTYIADDAFKDSGLLAVYTHGNQVTVEWAKKNGIISLDK